MTKTLTFNFPEDAEKDPLMVGLVFNDRENAGRAYSDLTKGITTKEYKMRIKKHNNGLFAISFYKGEHNLTIEQVNIDPNELVDFLAYKYPARYFAFVHYFKHEDHLIIVTPVPIDEFSPVLINGYEFVSE